MKSRNIEWGNDYLVFVMIVIATILIGFLLGWIPVEAAPPAPPEVKPCQEINTANVSETMVITIFYCVPEQGIPYKINSLGFMLNED